MSENQENINSAPEKEAPPKKESKSKVSKKEAALAAQIVELTNELAAEKDSYLRLCAEYVNFRKRTAKEKTEKISNGNFNYNSHKAYKRSRNRRKCHTC